MIYYLTKEIRLFQDLEGITVINDPVLVYDYFKDKDELGFDTETEGFDPYTDNIIIYQLGDYDNQFVVDYNSFPVTVFKSLLQDNSKTILMQNAKFDLRFLYKEEIIPQNIYDTYLAEAVLFTGIKSARKGLDHLAMKYCNIHLNKDIRRVIHYEGASARVILYGAGDVKCLIPIKDAQLIELEKKDLKKALDLDNLFVRVLAYVEYCGIYLNQDLWKRKMNKDKEEYDAALDALNSWIVENNIVEFIDPQLDLFNPERTCNINWSSSKQVIPLMQKLGVDTTVVDEETGKPKDSVDTKVLTKQRDKSDLIDIYLSYKAAEKRVSTYGQNFLDVINPVTGRIHSSFNQILSTGRMSSGGKQGEDRTVNVQNIPAEEETRTCFTNQFDTTTLINCDYSQQENVVFANWTQEPNLIKFYKDGLGDMHSYIASKIFKELEGVDLATIKKEHPEKRQIAKSAGFAIAYGGQGPTIAENVNISIEEGDRVYESYLNAFPGFKKYADKVLREAIGRGYILFNNISRRKAFIDYYEDFKSLATSVEAKGFWDNYRWHKEHRTAKFENEFKPLVRKYFKKKSQIGRMALNYPIQASAAEITKLAGVYFFDYIVSNGLFNVVKISNIVHDEILLEVPTSLADKVSKELKISMEKSGDVFCKTVPLQAEPVIDLTWHH